MSGRHAEVDNAEGNAAAVEEEGAAPQDDDDLMDSVDGEE